MFKIIAALEKKVINLKKNPSELVELGKCYMDFYA